MKRKEKVFSESEDSDRLKDDASLSKFALTGSKQPEMGNKFNSTEERDFQNIFSKDQDQDPYL